MFLRSVIVSCVLLSLGCVESLEQPGVEVRSVAEALGARLHRPDEPGRYAVGASRFSVTMTGGRVAAAQVYYPTRAEPDCDTRYTVFVQSASFEVASPLCAVLDAPVAPGRHPLVVYDHGGGAEGEDHQLLGQLPLHETLASHGFVVVVARHSANAVNRIHDLRLLTDHMLARNADPADAFFRRLDPARIGTSGMSAGGTSSFNFAAGHDGLGIAPEARLRAAVFYEPGQGGISFTSAAGLTVPYLIMGGTQFSSGVAIPALFDTTTGATPRVHVNIPGSLHLGFVTGTCTIINAAREAALASDPDLPEPLTTLIPSNPVAFQAYDLWHLGDRVFAMLGAGFGSGRHFCNRVGVDSVRSLDTAPADGFTDEPPFITVDPPFTLAPAVPSETMEVLVTHYTVAFFQVYLAGDPRYRRFLRPGYAERHDLPVTVEIAR